MIQRHLRDGTPADFASFDYANDGEETVNWLESLIKEIPDKREQHRLQAIVDQLKLGLAKLGLNNLDDASRNPDGTYDGVKALKWISDVLGGNLSEVEIQAEWEKAKARKELK